MTTSLQELDNFTQFAQNALAVSDVNLTLEDCVRLWRRQCEQQSAMDDVRQGLIDYDNGLAKPLAVVFQDVRRQLGIVP